MTEIFINYSSSEGRVVEASIEKKGNCKAFAYTLKCTIEKRGQQIHHKKSISAAEFIALQANKIKNLAELFSIRMCTIQDGLYMIVDFYPQVPD